MLYIIIMLLIIASLFYLNQKCKERVKALKRMIQTDDERLKKWMNVMVNDFMSSEESCEEDDTFVIRPLPWRSFKVNEFFGRLDTTSKTHRSSQSQKMRNGREPGEPSERPCPITKYGKSLLWAFSRAHHPVQSPSATTPSRSHS